jgi:crotonobetaine/carnitine-CoA ligase
MAGYWDDEPATAAAFRDGWLHTGDFGRVDSAGYLYFVERKVNMIKRAGENVAAGEVEDVLLEHSAVLEAAVVGVADPLRDEAVKAFIVLGGGSFVSTEELEQHCAEFLAPFKVPTLWSFLDELPKSALGKIDHEELRGRVPTSATSAP